MTDFSFDNRVAQIYNQQRAHSPEVSRKLGEAIAAEAGPSGLVLEMGVGTGRIAYPVAAAGSRVVGFDLSHNMLNETAANQRTDIDGSLHLLQADMHHMPFPDNTFDAVIAVHVLHLSKNLRGVLQEIARVLKPGGAFIRGNDWMDPESVIGKLRDQLRVIAIKHMESLKPPSAGVPIQETLAELGGTEMHEVIAAEWQVQLSPEQRLQITENKIDAESWIIPDHLFDTIMGELRSFARETWGDLDTQQDNTRRFTLKVTRGDW
jgi:ubiquinone/menaquinone biosynthesis C-methylase UbiE